MYCHLSEENRHPPPPPPLCWTHTLDTVSSPTVAAVNRRKCDIIYSLIRSEMAAGRNGAAVRP